MSWDVYIYMIYGNIMRIQWTYEGATVIACSSYNMV